MIYLNMISEYYPVNPNFIKVMNIIDTKFLYNSYLILSKLQYYLPNFMISHED